MSEQETSRSPQSNLSNMGKSGSADVKSGQDIDTTQFCNSLSSPDSGMGNTIFSSPEKSDKDGNESSDDKERDGSDKGVSPLKIRLSRNNVYGSDVKNSPNTSSDNTKWNHIVNNKNAVSPNTLKRFDDPKLTVSSHSPERNNITLNHSGKLHIDSGKLHSDTGKTIDAGKLHSETGNTIDAGKLHSDTGKTIQVNKNNSNGDLSVKKAPVSGGINAVVKFEIQKFILNKVNNANNANHGTVANCGAAGVTRDSGGKMEIQEKSINVANKRDDDTSCQNAVEGRRESNTSNGKESVGSSKEGNIENVGNKSGSVVKINFSVKSVKDTVDTGQEVRPVFGTASTERTSGEKTILENHKKEVSENVSVDKDISKGCENGGILAHQSNCFAKEESIGTENNHLKSDDASGGVTGVKEVNNIEVNGNHSETKKNSFCHNERLKTKEILGVDVEMGIDLDAIRDTDSEAGESCCSDDQDMCEGGNGCIHQGVCDTEQNWDYLMDEEFNVPKKPMLNGTAEQLERRSSLKRKAAEEAEEATPTKCKRGIQFEGVTVFYFPRSQGFTCVPSQGGSTLGMSRRHSYIRQFSLAEHAVEQRRAHREYLLRLRQQRSARERGDSSSRGSSSEDSEENSEEASDLSDSELDADSYYFLQNLLLLQPLPIRQRRALLRQAGICRIEGVEKEECKNIRVSRELCGCQCKVFCDPDTCQCSAAGIRCQVDRHNFPCGCSREGCGNTFGRIEFNPIRVRTHFIHTLMRIEIEKRQHQQHQQQQQQHQQWQHQHRAKWLATTSATANGFSSGSGVAAGNLPFFEGTARESASGLAVADLHKFSSTVEMASCVSTMNAPLYPHFESRQMLGPAAPPPAYVQQDTVGDFNSGTCSVFGGLGTTFDPASPYGACHSFPSSSVVPPQVVAPQVAPPQPSPEPYNTLSKFANTANIVSTSFPYSGAIVPVNCSNTHNNNNNNNNFCVPAVHDTSATTTVFGHYHEHSTVTQNLFKASMTECSDFQPSFEATISSSSSASSDKIISYMPATSLLEPSKDPCNDYVTTIPEASFSGCSSVVEHSYKVDHLTSSSSMQDHTVVGNAEIERPMITLPVTSTHPSAFTLDTSHISSSSEDLTNQAGDSTETTENLGEIVKKSIVETVSA